MAHYSVYVGSYLITRKLQPVRRFVCHARRNDHVVLARELVPDGAQTGAAV